MALPIFCRDSASWPSWLGGSPQWPWTPPHPPQFPVHSSLLEDGSQPWLARYNAGTRAWWSKPAVLSQQKKPGLACGKWLATVSKNCDENGSGPSCIYSMRTIGQWCEVGQAAGHQIHPRSPDDDGKGAQDEAWREELVIDVAFQGYRGPRPGTGL